MCRALPRSIRSPRSSTVSSVAAGITIAPSLHAASMISHIATWLESWTMMRSPRRTSCSRKKFGNLIGAPRHLGEAQLQFGAVIVHDPKGRLVVSTGEGIKIIERPIELVEFRPAEIAIGGFIIFVIRSKNSRAVQNAPTSCPLTAPRMTEGW